MSLDEIFVPCAQIVEKADPLRFRTVMAAPVTARGHLFALYAFNVEVARAPWVTAEPMIAEMRLQWWRDALEEIATGSAVRAHEVTTSLAQTIGPELANTLDHLVAARRWDIYRDPFEDQAHFDRYIDATAGALMWSASAVLGAPPQAEPRVRALAYGAGVAAFLRAVPALEAAGRVPLLDGRRNGVSVLARHALRKMSVPRVPRAARPALWPAIGARVALHRAVRDPLVVADGRLPEGVPNWKLTASALSGRLWL
ncbi:MAG: squalene/phytoene synthase family protein [Pseudomonadota bacterium]